MATLIKVIKRTSDQLRMVNTVDTISSRAHRRQASETAVIVSTWVDELRRDRIEELRILERRLGWKNESPKVADDGIPKPDIPKS